MCSCEINACEIISCLCVIKVSSDSEIEKESDINWFVWKDLIGDTVIESRNDVVKVMNNLMKGIVFVI